MGTYKDIEEKFASFIHAHYHRPVEVGIGRNPHVAVRLAEAGLRVIATDIIERDVPGAVRFVVDDICAPDFSIYRGADIIYAVRPGVEMIPCLMEMARAVGADCIVYHLGNEIYLDGGEVIDAGIILHRYVRSP
ncbi:hypothetical protein AZH53_06195 [Methanomicrobiaceae archaeon CYW5]|uniref:UPF0146 family protein n=1 Tax=Methanovulcanius yangii TaxID=1789227 RepID=UPI0029CA4B03|nr:UPF0146 family protein [Methanovulcanius yangii]MBT8507999.1 hypothetical protein [Methanovulcanius yangii]